MWIFGPLVGQKSTFLIPPARFLPGGGFFWRPSIKARFQGAVETSRRILNPAPDGGLVLQVSRSKLALQVFFLAGNHAALHYKEDYWRQHYHPQGIRQDADPQDKNSHSQFLSFHNRFGNYSG